MCTFMGSCIILTVLFSTVIIIMIGGGANSIVLSTGSLSSMLLAATDLNYQRVGDDFCTLCFYCLSLFNLCLN